jgi:hypothetical protein
MFYIHVVLFSIKEKEREPARVKKICQDGER